MKLRVQLGICLIAGIGVMGLGAWYSWPWYAVVLAVLTIGVYALLATYERMAVDPKRIALVATMAALASVGRAVLQFIPGGSQPATFFVIMSGFAFGPATGGAVGVFTALGSDFFLGEGGWTPWQMAAWGLVGITAGLVRRGFPKLKPVALIPFAVVWGYLFGWILNTSLLLGGSSVSVPAYLALCGQSFMFDTWHAMGTAFYILVAGTPVFHILERFRRKLDVVRVDTPTL